MPRFLIVTEFCTSNALQRAAGLLGPRFPEIFLEAHRITDDNHTHMLCHAPSAEHTRRWLQSADIRIDSITRHADPRDC